MIVLRNVWRTVSPPKDTIFTPNDDLIDTNLAKNSLTPAKVRGREVGSLRAYAAVSPV